MDETAQAHVAFDDVSLAWEGFQKGVDYPLDFRLSNIAVTDSAGRHLASAPQAHLTFSLAGLLLGRIIPRAIEVDHAQLTVTRESSGALNLGLDLSPGRSPESGDTDIDIRQFREQLSSPASSDHGRMLGLFDQIQRAHLRDAELTLRDRETGLVIQALGMDLDLNRASGGHVRGSLRAPVSIDGRQAHLTAQVDWATGTHTNLDMHLTAAAPAHGQPAPASAGFLAGFDLPFSVDGTIGFDPDFALTEVRAELTAGSGYVAIAQGTLPLRGGTIAISGTPAAIVITKGHLDLGKTPDGNPETADVGGTITYAASRLTGALTIGLTQIDGTDLSTLWPLGLGGGARPWVIEHVTRGRVTDATASVVVEADRALHDVVLTKATGDLDMVNGTFTWIDNMPPVEQANGHLHLVDPDTLDIHLSSGRQRIRDGGTDLVIKDAKMSITGLSLMDQAAVIHADIEGPVLSALTLLSEPRLHLLSTHPIGLKIGGGSATATLDFQFPLENKLSIDDVAIHADARLSHIRLPDVAAGRDLEDGTCDLAINKEGLTLKGQGSFASIPVTFDGTMDFKSGPPEQVVQKINVSGQPDATQIDAVGLPVAGVLTGPIPVHAVVTEHRGGDNSIALTGDLSAATISIASLVWTKPAAASANASVTVLMSHGQITKVNRIIVRGDGLSVAGSADFNDGHIRSVRLETLRLGRTQGHGTVHFSSNDPISIVLQGEQIDLEPKLTEKTTGTDRSQVAQPTTPAWTLDARFDHALLANKEQADNLLVKATGSGDQIGLVDAIGSTRDSNGFSVRIEPLEGKRRLTIDAKDAGSFLRGMDVLRTMRSGHLTLNGVFDQSLGLHPLSGTAFIKDVDVRNSPVLGKLLQAITVYGLIDALKGPEMNFSRVMVPFQYLGDHLDIDQAQADNPSLGLTAKGRIDFSTGRTAIGGTIVPAYFFNSMLGRLPLIGKLFSPENGGGIFALRFGLNGSIDDPTVSLNPVSALTPGFLREIFSVFDQGQPKGESVPSPGR